MLRDLLGYTGAPRVKLELARTLYLQGKYAEAKKLFNEVSTQSDTPWRVVDNVQHFVQQIEERAGYLKFGLTTIADSNPRNLAAQKEFAIGDLRVTPTEAPKKVYGLRYSMRAWKPVTELGGGGYITASYNDYPGQDLDCLTADAGIAKNLNDSGSIRGKAGVELGTFRLRHGLILPLQQRQGHPANQPYEGHPAATGTQPAPRAAAGAPRCDSTARGAPPP